MTPHQPQPPGAPPEVSVLLPAWNEAPLLGRCLDALLAIECPPLEVVVCAGGADGTFEIARRYAGPRVTLLEQQPGEGKQGALRRCLAASRGGVLYLTDADCVVPGGVLQAVVEPVVQGEAAAATGTSCPLPEQRANPFVLFQWSLLYEWRFLRRTAARRDAQRRQRSMTRWLLGRNAAVRRDALRDAGAFAEPVTVGDDVHLARALLGQGHRIRYVRAAVETDFLAPPGAFVRQQSRWFRGPFLHARRFGVDRDIVGVAVGVSFALAVVVWPLTLPWTRRRGLVAWLAVVGVLIGWRASCARVLATEHDVHYPAGYWVRLPVFTLLDALGRGWSLIDLALRSRRHTW
ncbi:MAG TPA: glycosyltransferase family 2 protein [Thermomicrobiaceae bacterium]|nr:glycosyltransferase family 2 protein [Thermomicrobiaceae bacterium]